MKNVVMHVCQVCWLGSVPQFIREFSRAYPEFHHVMIYLFDWKTNYYAQNIIQQSGVEVCHVPGSLQTEKLFREVDPLAIVLHSTAGKFFDGEWPWPWLEQWPIMFYHHMKSSPVIPADLDVFVSKELYSRGFETCSRRMKRLVFCPPCIDASVYERIKRKPDNQRCVIGRFSTDDARRFPDELLDILVEIQKRVPKVTFRLAGGDKYYKDLKGLKNVEMPGLASLLPQSHYNSFDMLVFRNASGVRDTWGRVVTEGMASGLPVVVENKAAFKEQIDDGVNGFLCDSDEEFVERLVALVKSPRLRYDIGMAARKKAVSEFGLSRLRRDTEAFFMRAVVRMNLS